MLVFLIFIYLLIALTIGLLVGSFAKKNGHSLIIWTILGFLTFGCAIISLCTALYAEREGHSFNRWGVFAFFTGVVALLTLHVAVSAENSGESFTLWGILGFFGGLFALIALETGVIAQRKGYSFVTYCLFALCFGVFALLIACLLPEYRTATTRKVAVKPAPVVAAQPVAKPTTVAAQPVAKPATVAQPAAPTYVKKSTTTTTVPKTWICKKCGKLNIEGLTKCNYCKADRK